MQRKDITSSNLNNNNQYDVRNKMFENNQQKFFAPFIGAKYSTNILVLIQGLQNRIADFLQINDDKFKSAILNNAIEQINNLNSIGQNDAQMLDLYLTINSVLAICSKSNDVSAYIKEFLAVRENLLIGDSNDYCYNETLANNFCYNIATILYPQQPPMNILLHDAMTEHRSVPWQDVTTLENDITSPGSYFRTDDNCINLYIPVLERAIANLNRGQCNLNQIWFTTDEKSLRPLSQEELNILKQRSPSLHNLVTYTEKLESCTGSISKRFDDLRNGLCAGANEGGNARPAAHVAVSQFFKWWDGLDNFDEGKLIKQKISKINSLAAFITKLSKVKDVCVHALSSDLTSAFASDSVRNSLRAIENDKSKYLSTKELKEVQKSIELELADYRNIKINKNIFDDLLQSPQFMEKLNEHPEALTYSDVKLPTPITRSKNERYPKRVQQNHMSDVAPIFMAELKQRLEQINDKTPHSDLHSLKRTNQSIFSRRLQNIQQTFDPLKTEPKYISEPKIQSNALSTPNIQSNHPPEFSHPPHAIHIEKHGLFKHLRQRHAEKKYEKELRKHNYKF